jgi:hypothetical protein
VAGATAFLLPVVRASALPAAGGVVRLAAAAASDGARNIVA